MNDRFHYDALVDDALRSVVRRVLTQVAEKGLPGSHHFYISFRSTDPGVMLPDYLRAKYPEEMTIVLQHRFWDLTVNEDRFDVKLTFDGIPERLVVPFASIKVFFDPSVRYGLQFEDPEAAQEGAMGLDPGHPRPFGSADDEERTAGRSMTNRKRPLRKPRLERVEPAAPSEGRSGAEEAVTSDKDVDKAEPRDNRPAVARTPDLKPVPAPSAPGAASGAQIVSLSDFRKK